MQDIDWTVALMVAAAFGCGWFWGSEWERGSSFRVWRGTMRRLVADALADRLRREASRGDDDHGTA